MGTVLYNYTMLQPLEGMTIEERRSEFIRFLADGNHFPDIRLKVRETGMEIKNIEITLESKIFADLTYSLDLLLDKANSIKATINTSDTEYWLTLESPKGTQTNILDVFKKHKVSFSEETVLKTDVRDKSKVVFSLKFVN